MPVAIRLARGGHRNLPFYRIMAADSRKKRDGRFLEKLGSYCPVPDKLGCKHLKLNTDRFKYWIAVGATPSLTVTKILSRFGLLPPPPSPVNILAKAKELEAINPSLLKQVLKPLADAGKKKKDAAAKPKA